MDGLSNKTRSSITQFMDTIVHDTFMPNLVPPIPKNASSENQLTSNLFRQSRYLRMIILADKTLADIHAFSPSNQTDKSTTDTTGADITSSNPDKSDQN